MPGKTRLPALVGAPPETDWTLTCRCVPGCRVQCFYAVQVFFFFSCPRKFWSATIALVIPDRPHGMTGLPLDGFSWRLIRGFSENPSRIFRVWLRTDKSDGYLKWRPIYIYDNTGCLQKNGAISEVNKKFISHLTRAKRTPSAAATVQVSHALPAVRFSCLLRGRGTSLQHVVAAGAHRKPFPAATPCCKLAPQ